MEQEWLILELGPERAVVRVGRVLARNGPTWNVEWPDGSNNTVRLGTGPDGTTFEGVQAGTTKHRLIARRTEFDALLRSDPGQAFEEVLGMTGRATSAAELKRTFTEARFDGSTVAEAWERASKAFATRDHIVVINSGTTRRYRLQTDAIATVDGSAAIKLRATPSDADRPAGSTAQSRLEDHGSAVSAPRSPDRATVDDPRTRATGGAPDRESRAVVPGRRHDQERSSPAASGPPRPSGAAQGPMQLTAASGVEMQRTPAPRGSGSAATASATKPPLDVSRELHRAALGKAVDDEALESAVALEPAAIELVYAALRGGESQRKHQLAMALKHPLASGVALATLSEETIAAAIARASTHERLAFLALPRPSKSIDAIDPVALAGTGAADELLNRAASEYSTDRGATRADIPRALAWIVQRVVSTAEAGALNLATILRIGALDLPETSRDRAELVADALARCVTSLGSDGWLGVAPADRISVALRATSASPAGARSRVMQAVHGVDPSAILNPIWWKGITIDDLLSADRGPLSKVFSDPRVAEAIVRPLYRAALEDVGTRRRLMDLLGAPPPVAQTADDDDVARALARVATGSDGLLRSWLVKVRDDAGRASLESTIVGLSRQLESAREDAARANATTSEVEARLHVLEDRLRDAGATSDKLRDSQVRQIQIDTIRAFATLASFVARAIRDQRADRMLGRIEAMAERQGLASLGAVGQIVPYEPAKHDLVGPSLEAGESVVVRQSGYTWVGPDGEIVLVRAEVEAAD